MGVAVTLVVASLLRRLWARYTMLRLIRSRPNEVVVPIPPVGVWRVEEQSVLPTESGPKVLRTYELFEDEASAAAYVRETKASRPCTLRILAPGEPDSTD